MDSTFFIIVVLIFLALLAWTGLVTSNISSFPRNPTVYMGCNYYVASSAGPTDNKTISGNTEYAYGATGTANTINQIATGTVTLAASATNNFSLSTIAGFNDAMLGASPTFTAIRYMMIELLSVAQGGGAAAASITIGNAGANPWIATSGCPFTGTNVFKIFSGLRFVIEDPLSTTGIPVTAGSADILKMLNNDASLAASVRITLWGYK